MASAETFNSFLLFRTLMNCDVSMATALSQAGGSRRKFHTHHHSPDTHRSDWCTAQPQDAFTHEHLEVHTTSRVFYSHSHRHIITTSVMFELQSESHGLSCITASLRGGIISMLLGEVCGIISEARHLPGQSVCNGLYITVML